MRGPAMLVLLATLAPVAARAVQLDALELGREWRLRALKLKGHHALGGDELRKTMLTKPRRWFTVWRAYPPFDPITFRTDLQRLERLYRSRGYYEARIVHDIELPREGDTVKAVVYIEEGPAVRNIEWNIQTEGT